MELPPNRNIPIVPEGVEAATSRGRDVYSATRDAEGVCVSDGYNTVCAVGDITAYRRDGDEHTRYFASEDLTAQSLRQTVAPLIARGIGGLRHADVEQIQTVISQAARATDNLPPAVDVSKDLRDPNLFEQLFNRGGFFNPDRGGRSGR